MSVIPCERCGGELYDQVIKCVDADGNYAPGTYCPHCGVDLNITVDEAVAAALASLAEQVKGLHSRQANGAWCGGYRGLSQPQFPGYDDDDWLAVVDRAAVLRLIEQERTGGTE